MAIKSAICKAEEQNKVIIFTRDLFDFIGVKELENNNESMKF